MSLPADNDAPPTDEDTPDMSGGEPRDGVDEAVVLAFEEELAAANRRADENWDKYLRAEADLDNYRRAAERRRKEGVELERRRLLGAFLSVADNLQRALAHTDAKTEDVVAGIEATNRDLKRLLDGEGVVVIDALEEDFDPTLHEAVSVVEMPGLERERVVAVEQSGYTLNGDLLRPARVVVGQPPEE